MSDHTTVLLAQNSTLARDTDIHQSELMMDTMMKPPSRLPMAMCLVGFVGALGAGCSTGKSAKTLDGRSESVQRMKLDPMLIRAGSDGEPGETISVDEIFKRGYEAYSARRYEMAAKRYAAVVEYFDDSKYYLPALYNAGLSYEKLERWQKSASFYKRIIDRFPDAKDAEDAYYRLANAYDKSGRYQEVIDLMTKVLLRKNISNFDRLEAYVRQSNALLELGHYNEAADGFRTMLELNDDAPAGKRLADGANLVVEAYFGLGRSYHERVDQIDLVLPTERMGKDLKEKARLFTAAQSNYLDALRQHHPRWSIAAGYMIGKLYEDFYTDIFNAEIPDDLGEEEVALYFEELRSQIRPLMERAVSVYERNLSLSRRMKEGAKKNRWVNQTSTKLERLENFLNDPITQRRAEILVAHGQTLEHPWDPRETAVDLVDVAVEEAAKTAYQKNADDLDQSSTGPDT